MSGYIDPTDEHIRHFVSTFKNDSVNHNQFFNYILLVKTLVPVEKWARNREMVQKVYNMRADFSRGVIKHIGGIESIESMINTGGNSKLLPFLNTILTAGNKNFLRSESILPYLVCELGSSNCIYFRLSLQTICQLFSRPNIKRKYWKMLIKAEFGVKLAGFLERVTNGSIETKRDATRFIVDIGFLNAATDDIYFEIVDQMFGKYLLDGLVSLLLFAKSTVLVGLLHLLRIIVTTERYIDRAKAILNRNRVCHDNIEYVTATFPTDAVTHSASDIVYALSGALGAPNFRFPEKTNTFYNAVVFCEAPGCNASRSGGPLKMCSKCKNIRYCSRECQVADWKKHKPKCHK